MSDLIKSFISEFNANPTFEAQKKLESRYVEHYEVRPVFQKEIIKLVKAGQNQKPNGMSSFILMLLSGKMFIWQNRKEKPLKIWNCVIVNQNSLFWWKWQQIWDS